MKIAIVALSQGGLDLARRLQPELDGAVVHGLADRADGADVPFTDTMAHLRGLFAEGTAIIGVFAAGITIRALAPNLANKKTEAPVIALAEDGSVAVPLLGGHRGANRLARQIAGILDGSAAITTAGDLGLGLALDEPPRGWTVANPQVAKTLAAAMLAGDSVRLIVEAGDDPWPDRALFSESGDLTLLITARAGREDDKTLVIHPPVLALGVGCERGASTGELQALVDETLAEAGLAPGALAAIASLDLKSDEEAVLACAENLGLPARFFTAMELEAEAPRLATPSEVVFSEVGCHGVSEGAALALAGPDAELVVPKHKSSRATCAIARSPKTIDTSTAGTARGRLAVVGIGPGADAWRTPEATMALARVALFRGEPARAMALYRASLMGVWPAEWISTLRALEGLGWDRGVPEAAQGAAVGPRVRWAGHRGCDRSCAPVLGVAAAGGAGCGDAFGGLTGPIRRDETGQERRCAGQPFERRWGRRAP